MAHIFIRVLNQSLAMETLLYVFKNQMDLGKKTLIFTLKHRDGYREFVKGTIDKVFNHPLMKEIEYTDLLVLEHYDTLTNIFHCFDDKIVDMEFLAELSDGMQKGAYFIIPKGNDLVYFAIKDYPMASYSIYRNEIISDKVFGGTATIYNNMCGKVSNLRGMFGMLQMSRRK